MFVSTCIERDSWQSLSVGQPCSWKRIPGLAERLQAATGEEPWAVCLSVRACLAHSLGGPACLQAQFEPACSLLPVCQAGPPEAAGTGWAARGLQRLGCLPPGLCSGYLPASVRPSVTPRWPLKDRRQLNLYVYKLRQFGTP